MRMSQGMKNKNYTEGDGDSRHSKTNVMAVYCVLTLSACSTAGTGNLNAEITPDRVSASLKFGANMSGPWKGRVELKRSITESSVKIVGEGSDVDRTPGHEATASVVKESLTAAIAGAKMGFAP